MNVPLTGLPVLETTRHGWLPKSRFGTLRNNYWTMKGPRNGLCRTTAEALTKDESSNPDHPFPSFGGGFDYYATPRISPAECALRWTTSSEAAVASCRVLSPATLLKFAPTFRTRAFHDWSTRKPSRSPCNYLNRFCKHWRFRPFRLRVVCYPDRSWRLSGRPSVGVHRTSCRSGRRWSSFSLRPSILPPCWNQEWSSRI